MPDQLKIVEMASAFYESCTLFTASDLGVFALLERRGGADVAEVAAELGLDLRGCRLLLDACVATGLLERSDDYYVNSPESAAFLVPGKPGDLSGAIRYNRDVYPAWARLRELAATGKPVERPQTHLGDDRERTRTFVLSMHARALGMGRAVVPLLALGGCRKLLDVGGGPGTYSVLIAQAYPGIECTVLDLPEVAAIAAELIAGQGMSARVVTLPGSYHDTPFPEGLDAVNFFGMLHQESPDDIARLFAKAYAAMAPGGIVHVMDMMTDASRARPKFSALFALNMALTAASGWVFSDRDLEGWLTAAGFENFSVRPLPSPMPHWLATARKPR